MFAEGSKRVILVRHGQTDWNAEKRFQGHTDIPLNTQGLAQAQDAAAGFRVAGPVRLVGSDLIRARQTAKFYGAVLEMPIAIDADFRETSGGQWEGMSHAEIARSDGDTLTRWRDGHDVRPGTTGELVTEVASRMVAAVHRHLIDVPDGGALVVFTHGGAARAAAGSMIGLPAHHWRSLGVLGNCAAAVLEANPETPDTSPWRLTHYNI